MMATKPPPPWAAAEDTLLTGLPKLALQRLRFEMSNEGSWTAFGSTYRLEASGANPASCVAATYAAVPTGAGSHWQIVASANLTDGAATTNVASGLTDENTTFVAGQTKDTGNQTTGISLTKTEFTESEFAIQATLNSVDDATYCFRLTHAGSTIDFTYAVYAQARVGKPDRQQIHYRWRNDDGTEATATWAAAEDTLLSDVPKLGPRRLRFEISNEGTWSALGTTYRLEVSGANPAS